MKFEKSSLLKRIGNVIAFFLLVILILSACKSDDNAPEASGVYATFANLTSEEIVIMMEGDSNPLIVGFKDFSEYRPINSRKLRLKISSDGNELMVGEFELENDSFNSFFFYQNKQSKYELVHNNDYNNEVRINGNVKGDYLDPITPLSLYHFSKNIPDVLNLYDLTYVEGAAHIFNPRFAPSIAIMKVRDLNYGQGDHGFAETISTGGAIINTHSPVGKISAVLIPAFWDAENPDFSSANDYNFERWNITSLGFNEPNLNLGLPRTVPSGSSNEVYFEDLSRVPTWLVAGENYVWIMLDDPSKTNGYTLIMKNLRDIPIMQN